MANYQLNKTGAEIDDALSKAIEHETSKANVDGAYENLTAGNAEQLISSVTMNDKVPYNFRTAGGSADIGNRKTEKIVGGTLAWNQLIDPVASATLQSTVSVSSSNGKFTITGSASSAGGRNVNLSKRTFPVISGHKYIVITDFLFDYFAPFITNDADTSVYFRVYSTKRIAEATFTGNARFGINVAANTEYNASGYIMLIDLTQVFGSNIANYIDFLEGGEAGAGVAWFKKYFSKLYYANQAGKLESVRVSEHNTIEFNAFDYDSGKAHLVGGMQYQITGTYTSATIDGVAISPDANGKFTPTENCELIVAGGNETDTCVHLVWDGERDGEFEEFKKNSYPLDASLELRGIPKLDANGALYYDGDIYESDGKVTRRYGIVDLGTLTWSKYSSDRPDAYYAVVPNIKEATDYADRLDGIICSKYAVDNNNSFSDAQWNDKSIKRNGFRIYVKDTYYSDYTVAQFKTAMSGVYLVYELAEATEESADAYQNPMIVDDFGTEEFVDAGVAAGTRDVEIPVGHDTEYQNNLRAKLEMSPDSPEGNGDYIVRQTNGQNSYVPLVIPTELPDAPTTDGTYHLKVVVANGEATYSWGAE